MKMEVSKELRVDIEANQDQLKIAIRNHQVLVLKLKADPDNVGIKSKIQETQKEIISIGLDQNELIERLRSELKCYQKQVKSNITNTSLDERTNTLNCILGKAHKQTGIFRSASVSSASTSDDSVDLPSIPVSPEPPLTPYELTQADFLGRMGLCTHEVFKELQNKRVERKRRSTANPHFLYGNRWDYTSKRRKNAYLLSSLSPPNTRQYVKKRIEQRSTSPTMRCESRSNSPPIRRHLSALNIPNLPSGLTIERISTNSRGSPDKVCIVCRNPGGLACCESCSQSFHVSCHNRPLVQAPRHCPKCLNGKKEILTREVGTLSVPPCMTVLATYVSAASAKEKIEEKEILVENVRCIKEEINDLEERKTELSISLETQKISKDDLDNEETITKQKIEELIRIVNFFKGTSVEIAEKP